MIHAGRAGRVEAWQTPGPMRGPAVFHVFPACRVVFVTALFGASVASMTLPTFVTPALAADPPSKPVPADKRVKVSIDRSKVDLPGHKLEVTLSRPADKIHLKVQGESGTVLDEKDIPFSGAAPGTVLSCSWTPSSDEAVARIEVIGYSTDGYWSGVALTPWKAEVPHEEVNFATDSDVIRESEVPKLQASLAAIRTIVSKHTDFGPITLYVVGHTDTVGTAEHNFALSQRRARSIGTWFRQHGLQVPIAFEGFGEASPRVRTADEVDEPQNRRVDYVIAVEPPGMPSGRAWHSL